MEERRREAQGMSCPKCGGAMVEGYTLEKGHYNSPNVAEWVEGPPEKSFWVGLKLKDRDRIPISTFRCENCGYLESYARPATEAG